MPFLTRDSGRNRYFEGGFHCVSFPQIGTGIQLTSYPFRAIVSRANNETSGARGNHIHYHR